MQCKYRLDLRGEGHDQIASTILSKFDIESNETNNDSICIVAWSRRLRLDELIGLSEVFPEAEMTVVVLQDANAIECSLIDGEVVWEAEYDFALDMDHDLSCLCGITDDGFPTIPAIVPEAPSLLSTLECWGWKGDGIQIREYSEEEIAEKGMVTYPQMREIIKAKRSRVSSPETL